MIAFYFFLIAIATGTATASGTATATAPGTSTATGTATPTLGLLYNPSYPHLPPPSQVARTLKSMGVTMVFLENPTPESIAAFATTDISLILSVPNRKVQSLATQAKSNDWISSYVVPFSTVCSISLIALRDDYSTTADSHLTLIRSMKNLNESMLDSGLKIGITTGISYRRIISAKQLPSEATFGDSVFDSVLVDIFEFLQELNSSLLVNIFPYELYIEDPGIPLSYAIFDDCEFCFKA